MIVNVNERNNSIKPNSKVMELLHKDFAECFNNEGKFDLLKFENLVEGEVDLIKENQGFDFLGKSYAKMLASMESTTIIVPDLEHNSKEENQKSENIYISGDNLDALKHLARSYANKVKCIYIDPPYNTGSDGFVYNDKFKFTVEELSEKLNVDDDIAERIISYNDGTTCSDAAWLTFMLPRLQIARTMLREDGVIFISIDDNEQANLKLLCDEIFGLENFIGCLPTIMNLKGNNDEFAFSGTHEYTLVYSKEKDYCKVYEFDIDDEEVEEEWEKDEIGYYKKGANLKATGVNAPRAKRPNLFFPLYINTKNPVCKTYRTSEDDIEILPMTDGNEMSWRWSKDKFDNQPFDIIVSKKNNEYAIYKKQRPNLGDLPSSKPKSTFYKPTYSSGNGTARIKELFNGIKVFNNPKPLELILDFLKIGIKENDIVLDFFAGSATTADAVMKFNAQYQDSKIKYILVQLPENLDEKYKKASSINKTEIKQTIDFLDSLAKPHTLDEVGRERILRAAKQISNENPLFKGDYGFKHYTLRELPEETIDKLEEFKPLEIVGASEMLDLMGGKEALLTTWLCDDHYGLNTEVQHVMLGGYVAYYMDKHLYLINGSFDERAMEALMEKYDIDAEDFHPSTIVVFGYSFSLAEMLMLRKNIPALKDNEDNKRITIDVRY